MSIELRGRGTMSVCTSLLGSPFKKSAAHSVGCRNTRRSLVDPQMFLCDGDEVPEHNARALAKALYRAIYDIEADSLSEPLVELVKSAGVVLASRCRPRLCGRLLYRLGDHRPRRRRIPARKRRLLNLVKLEPHGRSPTIRKEKTALYWVHDPTNWSDAIDRDNRSRGATPA